MALKDTIKSMHKYLECIAKDLKKADKGNKAASQRVRTCTIKLSKVSKTFRKESVSEERKTTKKTKKAAKRSAKRKVTKRKKRR
ncbi:MAG: Histone H1-like protein HC1 [Candidatus Anoxychlamydiales bacterium]|nr:Histone H1-like protein HC1 [Candidatus Anoxychlamydiales bacterium]NGX53130.1 Histone H1-like protein HC1 [Candidatus Anoxychlamydiales bacterium]